jgi:hypothetical protein
MVRPRQLAYVNTFVINLARKQSHPRHKFSIPETASLRRRQQGSMSHRVRAGSRILGFIAYAQVALSTL